MSRALTGAEVTPRGIAAPPDPGISHVEWADGWKTGYLFESSCLSAGSLYNYATANLRFTKEGLTVIVMSNSSSTDALDVAEHWPPSYYPANRLGSRPRRPRLLEIWPAPD